ncbi:MAG: hypothetical protein HQL68_09755 [Magnetococcales bacterium]|nr:hypothetical protein [Magnetococcales bacterium]
METDSSKDTPTWKAGRKLNTLSTVRSEMGKLYRLTANGQLPADLSYKMVMVLRELGRLITESDIENRIAELEALSQIPRRGKRS